ncbi:MULTISPECIES: imm11 family protein [Chryseobacterium]|jgi:hypothetical protein|uniref:Immunity MXAN-0049 protein domain-containing protein n=1 Tax=Chryseobacterium piscium TaxID=333702 RepID=A0A3D9BCP0_9FLAO|nr:MULTISPECIES: DUF1629 domain-containing protein [Chryseobacterium]REC51321.1 hypothetical protein DRF62_17545 [Chryseobacterium piscium]
MSKFFFLERDYSDGDIMITFEYHQSLELLQEGKESKLKTIPYIGMNDSDYITSGMNVFSQKFKDFIESMNIKNVNFIPITISQENHQRKDFYLLKFTQNEDCIDYEKSDIVIIQGLIRKIKKLKIKDDLNNFFFQIKGLKLRIAVNEKMKQGIESKNFHGIKFVEIE